MSIITHLEYHPRGSEKLIQRVRYVTLVEGSYRLHADDGSGFTDLVDIDDAGLLELALPLEHPGEDNIVVAIGTQVSWLLEQVQRRSKSKTVAEMVAHYPEQQFGFRSICVPVALAATLEEALCQPLLEAFDAEMKKPGDPSALVEVILDTIAVQSALSAVGRIVRQLRYYYRIGDVVAVERVLLDAELFEGHRWASLQTPYEEYVRQTDTGQRSVVASQGIENLHLEMKDAYGIHVRPTRETGDIQANIIVHERAFLNRMLSMEPPRAIAVFERARGVPPHMLYAGMDSAPEIDELETLERSDQ